MNEQPTPICDICETDEPDPTTPHQIQQALAARKVDIICYWCACDLADNGHIKPSKLADLKPLR